MFASDGKGNKVVVYSRRVKEPDGVPPLTTSEADAIRAVYNGQASPREQRIAINVIATKFCLRYENPYCEEGTDFRLGRAFVAHLIADVIDLKDTFTQSIEEDKDATN